MKRFIIFGWLGALVFVAVFFQFVAPAELPLGERLSYKLSGPFAHLGAYALGADEQGRAILVQVLRGVGTSLRISFLAVLLSMSIGLPFGIAAAWLRGWWERTFLFFADSFQAFPGTLLAIALAAFLKGGVTNLVFILGVVGWVGFGRLARAQVLALREREFLTAAKALGLPLPRIILRHLLPNMMRPLVVQASFSLAGVILAEATLSFLGLGLPVSVPSLGRMMDSGVRYLLLAPHLALIAGLAIFAMVLTFNLLGDALADRIGARRA